MSFLPKKVAMALLLAALPTLFVVAQTPQEVQKIIEDYDLPLLQEMENRYAERAQREKAEAVAVAQQRGLEVRMILEDGGVAELMRVLPDGTLIYYRTNNVDAARSTRTNHLNIGGSLGLNLDGQNMIAGVWDGGHARVSHQEYDGPGGTDRVTIMDGPLDLNFHAAHVTGTIMASGVVPQAKGMAPQARVHGYDWFSDTGEVATAAGNGLLLSNHSYGYQAPGIPDQWFGAYREDARDFDDIMYNAPYYLTVISAGNDGLDNTSNAFPLQGNPGYDKLSGMKTSKNAMIVANAQDATVDSNGNLISVLINETSSQGPTDDFRIKPDISGNGTGVFSTYETSDTAYNSISGTSMAAPNVTGSLLLLQQHANNVTGDYLRAATLKGLALHTADDAGPEGPDVVWGWGLMHTKRAAETINENGSSTLIQELTLAQGQSYSIQVEADSYRDLMASISWTDPASTVNNGLNSPTPSLVNDLDIRITQNGDTFYPWRLTGITTNSNDGDNIVDPFERVDVTGPSGTYTITVTHKGTLSGGSQNFSLIVTGLFVECTESSVPLNLAVSDITGTTALVSWDSQVGTLYDLQYRETGAVGWILIEDIAEGDYTLTGLDIVTEYEVQVRSKCPEGTPSDFTLIQNFTTTGWTYCDSESGNSLPNYHISNVTLNTINNNSTQSTYTDFTNISTTLEQGQTYTISITPTTDNPLYFTFYSVWIDYNFNGSFDDPGEQVFTLETDAQNPASGQFTVPTGIDPVTTRMRVSLNNSGIPGPCEFFTFGEVEDYTIVINPEGYFYQDGVWSPADPSGIATTADNITIMNGATSLSADTEANNLLIQPGASLSVAHSLNVNGDITNNGELIFISNATTTGQLAPFSGTLTGDVEVQRYIPARRAFRFLSSPVTTSGTIRDNWQEGQNNTGTSFPGDNEDINPGYGTHITGSATGENGFDATPSGNPSLFTLNNTAQSWEAVTNTDINTLDAGTPYRVLVRGDRSINVTSNSAVPTNTTLRMTGTMHTGTLNVTTLSATAGGINFIGNPYQASVNINQVIGASSNVNPAFYYVWDPTLGGVPTPGTPGGRGAYVTVTLPAGTNGSGSAANHFLQPGQAAFVATLNNGPTSLSFQEGHKDVSAPLTAVFSTDSRIDLRLYEAASFAAGSTPSDGLRLMFGEDQTNAITSVDAPKFYNQDENLASVNEGNLYSIENRALPEAGEVIPLFTNQYRNTNYMFEMERNDVEGVTAYLRDHYTGTETELINNDISLYAFNVDPADPNSIADDRFEIVFEELLGTQDPAFGSGFVLFPNPLQGDRFFIATRNLEGQNVTVEVYSMLGQPLVSHTQTVGANGRVEVNASPLASGIYTVSLSTEDGKRFTAKLITQ
tara:strand:- start:147 stop:4256 length:4110 start_codon:yes stop_codon:yes gene_type:complete